MGYAITAFIETVIAHTSMSSQVPGFSLRHTYRSSAGFSSHSNLPLSILKSASAPASPTASTRMKSGGSVNWNAQSNAGGVRSGASATRLTAQFHGCRRST